MLRRTILEWNKLPYGSGSDEIPPKEADAIAAVAAGSRFAGKGGGGVLEHGRNALRARGVVGVLASTRGTLEILPKIYVGPDQTEENKNAEIRKRLVHMLAVALNITVDIGAITELDWQRQTLLEILIRLYVETLADAVRKGMPRQYVEREEDLPKLRGKLDFARQFTRYAANPTRLACRFDVLSDDIALNQIMRATIAHLSRISISSSNQNRLRELLFVYSEITDVPVVSLPWNAVGIDRTNRHWSGLIALARMFLNGRYQTTTGGEGQGTALLFEMNTLFEEYVGRLVKRALIGTDSTVSLQGGRLYCLTSQETTRELFQTKPDIIVRKGNIVTHIIDTKWKRMTPRLEDHKQGISQADVYQMMAYGQLYNSPRLTLLYPYYPLLGIPNSVHSRYKINGQDRVIEAASIDVTVKMSETVFRLREMLSDYSNVDARN